MNYGPAGLRRLLINQCVFNGAGVTYPIPTMLIQRTGIATRTNVQTQTNEQIWNQLRTLNQCGQLAAYLLL